MNRAGGGTGAAAPGLLDRFAAVARARCSGRDPAHDFLHVTRVAASARRIALAEGAAADTAVAASLLHELFSYPKDHPESARSGIVCAEHAARVLADEGATAPFIDAVCYAIRVHPFSLGIVPDTLEARVVQDADRLDAIGSIGIARCFATGATMGIPFYHPDDPFCRTRSPDDRRWGLDHFETKLLLIPDRLHTATARAMAVRRADQMRAFLAQLERELDGA
jgi:uncharacterized protein